MEELKKSAAKFYASQKYNDQSLQCDESSILKTQTHLLDSEIVNMLIQLVNTPKDAISYEYEIGNIIYIICKYYEKHPAEKKKLSLFNFICNCISDLVTMEPVDYEDKYETAKGYLQMMRDVDKFGKMIQKHMEVFDKNKTSAELGGYYIIYCNIAMRLMCMFFPGYITSYEQQLSNFERYLTFTQIKKKDTCIKMYNDN